MGLHYYKTKQRQMIIEFRWYTTNLARNFQLSLFVYLSSYVFQEKIDPLKYMSSLMFGLDPSLYLPISIQRHMQDLLKYNTREAHTHTYRERERERAREAHIRGADNSASPRLHVYIISIIHSIANSSIPNSLFTSLEFFQQSEIPRHCQRQKFQ